MDWLGKSISLTVYGKPCAKQLGRPVPLLKCKQCYKQSSARPCRHCGSGTMDYLTSFVTTDTNVKQYESLVSLTASTAMLNAGIDKLTGAIGISTVFYFPIAKTREKKLNEGDWHTQKPDADNCKKALVDGLKQVLFADDCLIAKMSIEKRWTSATPRAEILVEELA
jgi:Holliday junction resolvase RusA-like endonuclease